MFAGMWLDRALASSPWFLILFVFGGAAAGFYSIYRKLMAAQRRADEARRAERDTR
jgi:F0F1-type ATP synthase assembly protein I